MKTPFTYISSQRSTNRNISRNVVSRLLRNIKITLLKRVIMRNFMKNKILTRQIIEDYIRAVKDTPYFSIYKDDNIILNVKVLMSDINFVQNGDILEFEDPRKNNYEKILLRLTNGGIDFLWDRENIRFLFSYPTIASNHEFEMVSKIVLQYMVDSFNYLDKRGDLV